MMKKNPFVSLLFTAAALMVFGCTGSRLDDKVFTASPELLPGAPTVFLPTLEHALDAKANAVYCATLPMAWSTVKKHLPGPPLIDGGYADLRLLDATAVPPESGGTDGHAIEAQVLGRQVSVRMSLALDLPFGLKMESIPDGLVFGGQDPVDAFGTYGPFNGLLTDVVSVPWYGDDRNAVVSLQPADGRYELLLYLSDSAHTSLGAWHEALNDRLATGRSIALTDQDQVVIPKIKLDYAFGYPELAGSAFQAGGMEYTLDKAWQRTAFGLDEYGARLESDVELITSLGVQEDPAVIPKSIRFDRPFFLAVRRRGTDHPYLALWVANTDILVSGESTGRGR